MSQHRGQRVKPRYGRLTALGSSLAVTLIAVLGGTGVLPSAAGGNEPPSTSLSKLADSTPSATPSTETETVPTEPDPSETLDSETGESETVETDPALDTALPADSGSGKRVVFSESRQRVWLVTGARQVQRTYLVSGSLSDNLDPGTYAVYSRSEQAWGIDDSGTMKYFVRFTQGDTGAAIGFHDIPVDDGKPVQTKAQLGTPQSHGCVRQDRPDAIALWEFAPLGTTVVVTA